MKLSFLANSLHLRFAPLLLLSALGWNSLSGQDTIPAEWPEVADRLVNRLDSLAAVAPNELLREHYQTVARFTRDTSHGFIPSEDDVKGARGAYEFFGDAGGKWETYHQQPRPLMLSLTSETDGKESYYWLFLPPDYDSTRLDYPFFLELHGSGGGRNNNPRKMIYQPLQPEVAGVPAQGYRKEGLYVLPWGRGDKGYRDTAEADIFEVLADFDRRFTTDPARQYMYGFSMGGAGTLRLAPKMADRWAAIASYSGALRNADAEIAQQYLELPVWLAWGETERWATVNRELRDLFLEAGVELQWQEVEGVGHNYLGEYQTKMLDWLLLHRKN